MAKKKKFDVHKILDTAVDEEIEVKKIRTGEFQVRLENVSEGIEELEQSIVTMGLMQPIGVAYSEDTEKSDEYDYELLWGQRRHYCYQKLGIKRIPARVIKKVLSKEEGQTISLNEGLHQRAYTTKDIWRAIEEQYLIHTGIDGKPPTPEKMMKITGIPASSIKDAVQDQLAKRLNGGEEIFNFATQEEPKIAPKQAVDIIYACRKDDGLSVDKAKAKKFITYYKSQDNSLRAELLKATRRNPGGKFTEWIEFAEKQVLNKSKPKLNLVLTYKMEDDIKAASEDLSTSKEEYAITSIVEKLKKDGYSRG